VKVILYILYHKPFTYINYIAHNKGKIDLPVSLSPNPKDFSGMKEYSRSKLMNILFTKELAKRLANKGVTVAAVHPGFVKSQFGRNSVNNPVFNFLFNSAMGIASTLFARSGEEGAKTTVFAAVDDSIKSGEYYDACAVGVVQPQGLDEDLALQLWNESTKAAGLDPNII
jgi:NAD(P)-dependent dehydrogenase (short-subunit alcohol dehydrogenase family)